MHKGIKWQHMQKIDLLVTSLQGKYFGLLADGWDTDTDTDTATDTDTYTAKEEIETLYKILTKEGTWY